MLDHVRSTCAETCAETCAVPHVVDECPNRLWHLLLRRVSDPIGLESPWWERSRVDRSTGHIFHKRGIPVVSFFGFPRVSRCFKAHPKPSSLPVSRMFQGPHLGARRRHSGCDETWWNMMKPVACKGFGPHWAEIESDKSRPNQSVWHSKTHNCLFACLACLYLTSSKTAILPVVYNGLHLSYPLTLRFFGHGVRNSWNSAQSLVSPPIWKVTLIWRLDTAGEAGLYSQLIHHVFFTRWL